MQLGSAQQLTIFRLFLLFAACLSPFAGLALLMGPSRLICLSILALVSSVVHTYELAAFHILTLGLLLSFG